MATTPASYSVPSMTRYGLINELNVVNIHAYNKYIEKFGFVPYVLAQELAGNEEQAENKEFKWYEEKGRNLGFFTAQTTVSGAAGAAIVVLLSAGDYSAGGVRSLPEVGMIFQNDRTGDQTRVSAVNKNVNSAHTVTLVPTQAAKTASVVAGDALLCRGYVMVGESSTKTPTKIKNIDKYNNFCTQIRADSTLSDQALMEKLEFQINGNYSYSYKQQRDDNMSLLWEREYLLMEGQLADNLGYAEEGTKGVVPQVIANGINATYSTFGVQSTFASCERLLDAQGAPGEYDVLSDGNQFIDIQNSIFNEVNNGAVIYVDGSPIGGIDLKRDFKSLQIYSRKYNFTRYDVFSEAKSYGSPGAGARSNFGLFIPRGKGSNPETRVMLPRFTVMYQLKGGANKWHTADTGLFADNPNSTTAERVFTSIGYFGVRLQGANQYMILKKS